MDGKVSRIENQILRRGKKKRYSFNLVKEIIQVGEIIDNLPKEDEVIKIVTLGDFSALSLIGFVANRVIINDLTVSSLRVGAKHLRFLDQEHQSGRIGVVNFIVGKLMRDDKAMNKKYRYYSELSGVCKNNGWTVRAMKNHSKIILMDTDDGKYVIETSSNLNDNPSMEQFSFEKNDELYQFYYDFLINT